MYFKAKILSNFERKKYLKSYRKNINQHCQEPPASSGAGQSHPLSSLCSHIFSNSSGTDPGLALKFCNLFLKTLFRTISLNGTETGQSSCTKGKKKTKPKKGKASQVDSSQKRRASFTLTFLYDQEWNISDELERFIRTRKVL